MVNPEIPPPYSEIAISETPTPQRDPIIQFGRYMTEIMAFTFSADFALLNHALGQPTLPTSASMSTTNSILTEDERAELLRLALIIPDMYWRRSGHQLLTGHDSDRQAVIDALSRPALHFSLSISYIFLLVNSYADHRCDETKRGCMWMSRTIVRPLWLSRRLTFLLHKFRQHLHAHVCIIAATAPDEHVRIMLGKAMKTFQEEELGIKKLTPSRYQTWPTDSWSRVYDVEFTLMCT
ncbi:hypothetical protein K504DRAFT_54231 [Pleomassaria siparia CBS 279.74]|uniref:Uncharacterized protein n=1 Tax=Pleomassaria siparia CBS 279.74 TaxID=1314801 RepID=A0A6G1K4B0_9PLEO|nr:hypothetical protein K504DRAFT_54231 [Pleomassaria siparia CBS 279.74]